MKTEYNRKSFFKGMRYTLDIGGTQTSKRLQEILDNRDIVEVRPVNVSLANNLDRVSSYFHIAMQSITSNHGR